MLHQSKDVELIFKTLKIIIYALLMSLINHVPDVSFFISLVHTWRLYLLSGFTNEAIQFQAPAVVYLEEVVLFSRAILFIML
ncbi:hypothetical protein DAI22_03g341400 [Oryza sativa Japonica Group]|nr:hypothetical protein DAI22_03g341400 [Oryza sativa Japonica Group]